MGATANDFKVIARFHAKTYVSGIDCQNFGGGRHAQADWRRSDMADVEVGAEALMFTGQEMLDRIERRRLNDIDHHRCGQYRNAAGPDKRRGMFGTDPGCVKTPVFM